jgi:hypothetical protein
LSGFVEETKNQGRVILYADEEFLQSYKEMLDNAERLRFLWARTF